MKIVIVKPIDKIQGHIKTTRFKNCHDDISSYYTRTGSIYTGLTAEEAKELGEKLSKDLSPNSDFWKDYFVRIPENGLRLDIDSPLQRLDYLFLRNHKDITDLGREPIERLGTRYVIVDEDRIAKREDIKNKSTIKALKFYESMTKMQKERCLRIFGINANNTSEEVINKRLFDIINQRTNDFIELWIDNKSRDIQWLIEEGIARRILLKKNGIYQYNGIQLGLNLAEAISYLNDPVNSEIKDALFKQIELKKKID